MVKDDTTVVATIRRVMVVITSEIQLALRTKVDIIKTQTATTDMEFIKREEEDIKIDKSFRLRC